MSAYAWVVLVPLAGAALVPLFALAGPTARYTFANLVGFATAGLALALVPLTSAGTGVAFRWLPGLADFSVFRDGLSLFLVLIAGCIGALIVLYSVKYMERERDLTRYYSLLILFIGAMVGLALTSNLLILYVFWEVVGLCSYALIGFFYEDPKAARAGLKAFLVTRVGDVGLLVGILTLYFSVEPHTFDLGRLMELAAQGGIPPVALATAAFGFLFGAVGKSAQFPLHVWLPDAMEAPTTISALIHAATMVNAGVYLVARTSPMFAGVPGWLAAVAWVGVVTAFLSATLALVEPDLKRLLAYSTISQLGYMLFSIGVGGVLASQFHLLSHAVFKALLFLCAGAVIHEAGTRNMYEMGGLGRHMRVTAPCFLVGALALSGVPVLNGFWSKDLVLSAAWHQGQYWPLAVAVLTAVLTAAYSLRAYYLVFCGRKGPEVHEAPAVMTGPLVVLAVGAVLSWLLVGPQSRLLEMVGYAPHAISALELIRETGTSPVLALSLGALALGLGIYAWARDPGARVTGASPALALVLGRAYGFDGLYLWVVRGVVRAGRALLRGLEGAVLDAANYAVSALTVAGGRAGRRVQTGDLNRNLVGVALGLVLMLACLFGIFLAFRGRGIWS
ncbi:MAG: NADH-quinone oxidoreductase subunit L [Acetobacteraceae bacterium]|nr:NADH-quinone oxidoreductase subunit L [Acetobacteraceae bacterium]